MNWSATHSASAQPPPPPAQAGRDRVAAAQAVLCERDSVDGPCWLEDVPAPLDDMPVWIRCCS
jgi:hypothetical protein